MVLLTLGVSGHTDQNRLTVDQEGHGFNDVLRHTADGLRRMLHGIPDVVPQNDSFAQTGAVKKSFYFFI